MSNVHVFHRHKSINVFKLTTRTWSLIVFGHSENKSLPNHFYQKKSIRLVVILSTPLQQKNNKASKLYLKLKLLSSQLGWLLVVKQIIIIIKSRFSICYLWTPLGIPQDVANICSSLRDTFKDYLGNSLLKSLFHLYFPWHVRRYLLELTIQDSSLVT